MSKSLSSRSLLAASIFMAGAAYSGLSYAADEAMEPEVWDVSAPDYSVDAQTIPLSVSEGTWMNLDVSPTGVESPSTSWETSTKYRSLAAKHRPS